MPDRALQSDARMHTRVEYRSLDSSAPLAPNALAAITFGESARHADPRFVRVGLEPLRGANLTELWLGDGPVHTGTAGPIRYCADGNALFGVLELDERVHGGIAGAARFAYASLREFLRE